MKDLATDSATTTAPKEVVGAFWDALYARDWDRIRSFFDPESVYFDVPTGPGAAGVGPDSIEARLRLGLDGLSGYDHGPATVVADGEIVVTEHTEMWEWATGETATLPFVSVQHVHDGVIALWKDYWDLGTLMASGPPQWQEHLESSDLSWIHDVTGWECPCGRGRA